MDNQAYAALPSAVDRVLAATRSHSACDRSRILVACELIDAPACPRLTQRKVALELAAQLHKETRAEVNVLLGAKARSEELQSYIASPLWRAFESLMVYRIRPREEVSGALVKMCEPKSFRAGPLHVDLSVIPRASMLACDHSATSEIHQVAPRT